MCGLIERVFQVENVILYLLNKTLQRTISHYLAPINFWNSLRSELIKWCKRGTRWFET